MDDFSLQCFEREVTDMQRLSFFLEDLDINWRTPVQGESSPVHIKESYSSLHDYL